ncbi:hypothetical protein F2Q70_00026847 [Brassica cretica]|uniref:Uncharacterized protein n=1 Tax=Brassica cretica TaxID=69181 RepID=A0A8S9MER3_BRACR|nr:hypothetical protein F2Q70_00026847 [Brassica cretica]KAF2616728.1 hypothetical protein F2Q68_00039293 [Brassica cretica]
MSATHLHFIFTSCCTSCTTSCSTSRLHVVLHGCAHTLLQRPDTASAQPPCFLMYFVFSIPLAFRIFTSDLGDPL